MVRVRFIVCTAISLVVSLLVQAVHTGDSGQFSYTRGEPRRLAAISTPDSAREEAAIKSAQYKQTPSTLMKDGVSCFEIDPHDDDQFPLSSEDCYAAIRVAIESLKSANIDLNNPREWTTFGRTPNVPQVWKQVNTCRVVLTVNDRESLESLGGVSDTFPPANIFTVASEIGLYCVANGHPPLGGWGLVGPKQAFRVTMEGHQPDGSHHGQYVRVSENGTVSSGVPGLDELEARWRARVEAGQADETNEASIASQADDASQGSTEHIEDSPSG